MLTLRLTSVVRQKPRRPASSRARLGSVLGHAVLLPGSALPLSFSRARLRPGRAFPVPVVR